MSTCFEPIKTAEIDWLEDMPYSIAFDDLYFSSDGGLHEARHVFIEGNQLIARWQALLPDNSPLFVIAEMGFGSGLNFILSWVLWKQYAPKTARLHFISCEKHPFTRDDLSRCLALWPELKEPAKQLLANYPILTPGFHFIQFDEGRVNLTLMLGDAYDCYRELLICGDSVLENNLRDYSVDAWFLDGFSPAKNPMMWSEELFVTMNMMSKDKTTLATFTAAGVVKQGLQKAGFKVHKKPGYGRKQEMLCAERERLIPSRHALRRTPWHAKSPKKIKTKRAIVVGAGLAGCYMAHALARRGWLVTLIDEQESVGRGASGNSQAILYPQLSSFYSPLNGFMLTAYLYAIRVYRHLLKECSIGQLSGMLQLAHNQKERISQIKLQPWLANYPELGTLVSAAEASAIAGVELQSEGLYIPHSGWLDSPALCEALTQVQGIHWVANTAITSLAHEGNQWQANEYDAEVLIIANGYRGNEFAETAHLPLKKIRGQMTSMVMNEGSAALRIPLCAEGHILPARDGTHALGATYHLGLEDNACYAADDVHNLAKLKAMSAGFPWSGKVADHWAGIRAAAPDYLPLVGPVARAEQFMQQFSGLVSNSKRWIPEPGTYYDGLYVCTGFGSRGLTTIPLSAEWLASHINNEPSCLPRTMVQSLSPARFLRRKIIHASA